MLEVTIPGRGTLSCDHLVLDYNGTLVVTADTFGGAARELSGMSLRPTILGPEEQGDAKASLVEDLGAARTVAVGNGSNDAAMLERAHLGILVNGPEGCAREALLAADIVAPGIGAALDLLLKLQRLVATWRR